GERGPRQSVSATCAGAAATAARSFRLSLRRAQEPADDLDGGPFRAPGR
ncbi:MAG: hypothetical protein AVDCRST_MAG90-1625, partial [uncultured Microvirga sp.]